MAEVVLQKCQIFLTTPTFSYDVGLGGTAADSGETTTLNVSATTYTANGGNPGSSIGIPVGLNLSYLGGTGGTGSTNNGGDGTNGSYVTFSGITTSGIGGHGGMDLVAGYGDGGDGTQSGTNGYARVILYN